MTATDVQRITKAVFKRRGDRWAVYVSGRFVGTVKAAHVRKWWEAFSPAGDRVQGNAGPGTRHATRHLWPSREDAAFGLARRAGLDEGDPG